MLRTVVGRAAGSAAAASAAAASSVATGSSQAHAHAGRPVRLYPSSSSADDRKNAANPPPINIEEDWLLPRFSDDDVLFSSEEVAQTVEDICGIATGSRVCLLSDSEADSDGIDNDANALIDQTQTNVVSSMDGMAQLARITTLMLNRPGVQREMFDAFQQEPELREMVRDLTSRKGYEGLIELPCAPLLPGTDPRVEDVTDVDERDSPNLFQSVIADLGSGLEAAGKGIARTGQQVGNFLGRAGRWMRSCALNFRGQNSDVQEEEELTDTEKLLGVAMCFACVIVTFIVAKRVGVFRIIRVAVTARKGAGTTA